MSHEQVRSTAAHPAFTMIELIMALSISTVVMLGVVSLLTLSSSAVPQPGGIQETAVDGADLLSRLSSDLACATQITQSGAAAIAFIVPDRTGDTLPETIAYKWEGTAGGPITREVNGAGPVVVLDDASQLAFIYTNASTTISSELNKTTGSSVALYSNLSTIPTAEVLFDKTVIGLIEPTFAAGDIAWTLESITVYLKTKGLNTETVQIEVRGCDMAGAPTSAVYASSVILESNMSGLLAPEQFKFPGIVVPVSTRLCVVVRVTEGGGDVWVGTAGSLPTDVISTTLSTPLSLEAVGTITSVTGGRTTRNAITTVQVRIQAGTESWTETINLPIVNPAYITPF